MSVPTQLLCAQWNYKGLSSNFLPINKTIVFSQNKSSLYKVRTQANPYVAYKTQGEKCTILVHKPLMSFTGIATFWTAEVKTDMSTGLPTGSLQRNTSLLRIKVTPFYEQAQWPKITAINYRWSIHTWQVQPSIILDRNYKQVEKRIFFWKLPKTTVLCMVSS